MSDSKKGIYELSDEELTNLAQGRKETTADEKITEAARFIYENNLRHGDDRISASLIYYTYKQWRGWDQKFQPRTIFFKDFTKYFESVRTSDGISYLLESKAFDLSKEQYWRYRNDLRNQRARQKKKPT
jgi:hypothetical protein